MSIAENTTALQAILNAVNELPEAGGGEPALQEKNVAPSTSKQEVKPDPGYDGLSQVNVSAMPTAAQATPSISVSSAGLITASATQTAGYVEAGTKSATKQLTTQGAQTITPGTSDKKISSGRYLTGDQTIKGDVNLLAENIKSGVSIFNVHGTFEGESSGAPVPVPAKIVNFYDYDGTCVYSYTASEAQALTELPEGPKHDGLIFHGWNWSLQGIKAAGGAVDVGATYTTDDGKTRFYISLLQSKKEPYLNFYLEGRATVDWGDGETDILTADSMDTYVSVQHVYASAGDYVITLDVDGLVYLSCNDEWYSMILDDGNQHLNTAAYMDSIRKAEIGNNVYLDNGAFAWCQKLQSVVLPPDMTEILTYMFYNCTSLSYLVIPSNVTSISDGIVQGCWTIRSLPMPENVTTIAEGAFYECQNLFHLVIPPNVESIGDLAFGDAYTLEECIFKCTTPPVFETEHVFNYNADSMIIYVPAESVDAYKNATNLVAYADQIRAEGT